MNDDLIVNEELEQPAEEVSEQPQEIEAVEAQPETEAVDRVDAWDEATAKQNYRELEKLHSRHAQEVGEYRKLVDQLLKEKPQETSQPQSIDLDSLLDDPTTAINRSLENNPEIRGLKESLTTIQRQAALADIKSKHPDAEDIWKDPGFQNYVSESPVRQRLAMDANNYDVEAANYLFNDWKSHTSTTRQEAEKTARLEKAKVDMSKAASEGTSGGKASHKTFNRTELARLKVRDPDKYNAMHDEILYAYEHGLVR